MFLGLQQGFGAKGKTFAERIQILRFLCHDHVEARNTPHQAFQMNPVFFQLTGHRLSQTPMSLLDIGKQIESHRHRHFSRRRRGRGSAVSGVIN